MSLFTRIIKLLANRKNMSGDIESKHSLRVLKECKGNKPDVPVPLVTKGADKLELPRPVSKENSFDNRDVLIERSSYKAVYKKGYSYYKRGWYEKAKEEFLQIYDCYHQSNAYYAHLLQTYRKVVDKLIRKKKYHEALSKMMAMFGKCPNYTISDVRKYKKIMSQQKGDSFVCPVFPEKPEKKLEPDFRIESESLKCVNVCEKPRGLNIPFTSNFSLLKLRELSDFLPSSLPHVFFDGSHLEYKPLHVLPSLQHGVYRFRESPNRNAFIASSKELRLYLYDWELNLIKSFDASRYSPAHTYLRRVDLSPNLSNFLFTIADKAYLLNSDFEIVCSWNVPHKEGWEKRTRSQEVSSLPSNVERERNKVILGLTNNPSKNEIKATFRRLALRFHPDKNPGNPSAESKMKEIIQAYEYLTNEKAEDAVKGLEDDEYWVNTIEVIKYEVSGMVFEIGVSLGSGEDWIYGSGFSCDGSRAFLGCYSGKTYQVNRNGEVEIVFVTPKREMDEYSRTNPVLNILEHKDFLYILTNLFLYILKDKKVVNCIRVHAGKIKWFEDGFILPAKKSLKVYLNDGSFLGTLSFKDNIKHICHAHEIFFVETGKKSFLFRLNAPNCL